jgi:2-dehydropantoate 2-reductase
LILLAVKTQDVDRACRQIRPNAADAPVVTLQNGIRGDETAAAVLGKECLVGGVVLFNASFLDPGSVTYGLECSLLLGKPFRENGGRVEAIAAILRKAVRTDVCGNISGARWTKLLVNVMGNGLEAMTGLGFGRCMEHSRLRRIGIGILKEAFAVADAAGVRLKSPPGLPIGVFRIVAELPVVAASAVLRLTTGGVRTLASTLQSIRRGKPTEIDYLNGEIVSQGEG